MALPPGAVNTVSLDQTMISWNNYNEASTGQAATPAPAVAAPAPAQNDQVMGRHRLHRFINTALPRN